MLSFRAYYLANFQKRLLGPKILYMVQTTRNFVQTFVENGILCDHKEIKNIKIANSVQTRQNFRKSDKTLGEYTEYKLQTECVVTSHIFPFIHSFTNLFFFLPYISIYSYLMISSISPSRASSHTSHHH